MKRVRRLLAVLLIMGVLGVGVVSAQSPVNLSSYIGALGTFSTELGKALPSNATIGLNWSDAYIGQFLGVPPRFGVGVTTGFTVVPIGAFNTLFTALGQSTPDGLKTAAAALGGVPLPGYAFDARIGGFILPFDVGLKFGILPATTLGTVKVEYSQFGFDVRYAVLTGGLVLPKVSVGLGYSRLQGGIRAGAGDKLTLGQVAIAESLGGGTATVELTNPALGLEWTANVIDLRAQASKRFLIIEPHLGLGFSMGQAQTKAGFYTDGVTVTGPSGQLTPSQLAAAGVSINTSGATVSKTVDTTAFRIYGGTSINILLLRVDLGANYNLANSTLGATVGLRVQL